MKIDWEKVWKDYNDWFEQFGHKFCKKCKHRLYDYSEWDVQQKKIQQLVNKQLKDKK